MISDTTNLEHIGLKLMFLQHGSLLFKYGFTIEKYPCFGQINIYKQGLSKSVRF